MEDADHPIARLEDRDAFTDGDDLAGGIAAGNMAGVGRRRIGAEHHRDVAIVQRDRVHAQQQLAALRLGSRLFVPDQIVEAAERVEAIGFHGNCPFCGEDW